MDSFAANSPSISIALVQVNRWMISGCLSLCLLMGGAIHASCQKKKAGTQRQDTVMKFFYLVNQSGVEVEVRVLADEKELFVRRMKAETGDSPGIIHPSNGKHSTMELKVAMDKQARQLTVQESSHLKKCKTFDITKSGKEGAGFQVIIGKDEITLIQEYYPAR